MQRYKIISKLPNISALFFQVFLELFFSQNNQPLLPDNPRLFSDTCRVSTDFSRFHNLNTLAAEICAFDGEAKIIVTNT
jgi:hypothetical protein